MITAYFIAVSFHRPGDGTRWFQLILKIREPQIYMTKEECVSHLIYLIEKYVDDPENSRELISLIEEQKDRPPAKVLIYKIFEMHTVKFSDDDKILINDISFFFG
ncbi:hypothetical protein J2T09_002606 [Neorhizobium huautlense]|uniref:Uncharacterized protein n=1 Tax=Neorhizobium huautlense TaxID=67774 RepID=A0ABT9PVV8_9HYPH|nr:hypothetical protein [Neorhizobium huautlense]MDP9837849.1 hypothetical protein [Neorhizobium huautlense]